MAKQAKCPICKKKKCKCKNKYDFPDTTTDEELEAFDRGLSEALGN